MSLYLLTSIYSNMSNKIKHSPTKDTSMLWMGISCKAGTGLEPALATRTCGRHTTNDKGDNPRSSAVRYNCGMYILDSEPVKCFWFMNIQQPFTSIWKKGNSNYDKMPNRFLNIAFYLIIIHLFDM